MTNRSRLPHHAPKLGSPISGVNNGKALRSSRRLQLSTIVTSISILRIAAITGVTVRYYRLYGLILIESYY
jgi:hypothetical protein